MFETAELGRKIPKDEYDRALPDLRTSLLEAQNELRLNPKFVVLLFVGGFDTAGKSETVNTLLSWMDPRYIQTSGFGPRSDEERARPEMWRYWRVLPPRGYLGILFNTYYTEAIQNFAYGQMPVPQIDAAARYINRFEQQLIADGALILKFWFHISKTEQKRRLKALASKRETRWRVTRADWDHLRLYDRFRSGAEHLLRETSTGNAPWRIIDSTDERYRQLTVGQQLSGALQQQLQRCREREAIAVPIAKPDKVGQRPTILDTVDLAKRAPEGETKSTMELLQARLNRLSRRALKWKVPLILVFEGWDAAGKGGAIRRITQALDARYYRVIPVAAPTDEELARHYMWRFWRSLPAAGHTAIFDRSWYGRVLVERVEGYCREEEWRRAYHEINEFEELLYNRGAAIAKFWLHIDKEEQARRFAEREKTPYKRFKITAEDYRNRDAWPYYEDAVHEMVQRCSTEYAPWTLVEANHKPYARIKVLETCCDRLEAAIERRRLLMKRDGKG